MSEQSDAAAPDPHAAAPDPHAAAPDPSGRRLARLTVLAVSVPVLILVAFAAAFAIDAVRLADSARALEEHAVAAQDALDARDAAALAAEVDALESAARDFRAATDGPHWWIATHLAFVEDQATPLVRAGDAAHAIAADALAPLLEVGDLAALEPPAPRDGRIDPTVLEPYRPALAVAAETLEDQLAIIQGTDLSRTLPEIREPFEKLTAELASLTTTIASAHVTAELMPALLGHESPRTYVVLVQNNAEPRATGGIPGAFIELTIDDGRLATGRYVPAHTLTDRAGVAELTDEERWIFTDRMVVYPQDVNFTPDFPRTAQIASAFWEAGTGEKPDGVLSLDPVALGWMLGDASPLMVDGLEISGATAAQVLLSDAYFAFPIDRQDAFFANAAAALFRQLVEGTGSVLDGTERAVDAGRLLIWSADADEQALLERTPVAGAFLERADAVGVFLNDGSGSKIGYYIDAPAAVTDLRCADGSLAGQTVTVELEHTYAGDVADLPDYVGVGGGFVPVGEFHATLLFYSPEGTRLMSVTRDGEAANVHPAIHEGRRLAQLWVTLAPGEKVTVEFELETARADIDGLDYVQTPGPREWDVTRDERDAAGC